MCAQANETSIVHWYTSLLPFSVFPISLLPFHFSLSLPCLFLLSSPSLPPSLPFLLCPCPLPDRTWTHGCIMWSGWYETAGRHVIGSSTSSAANRAVATLSEHHQITVQLFYEMCFLYTQIPSHTPSHLPPPPSPLHPLPLSPLLTLSPSPPLPPTPPLPHTYPIPFPSQQALPVGVHEQGSQDEFLSHHLFSSAELH